jgi:2-dehydropantoate 2-reductase
MKIVVFGAGGIGGYLGAVLSNAGHDVVLICRGAHLDAIQRRGLRIRDSAGEWLATDLVARERLTVETPDVIINGVKLYDLDTSARAIAPYVGPETIVIPVANGVTAHEQLAAAIPMANILPGSVFMSSHIAEPGLVVRTSESSRLSFGELDGSLSERAMRFHQAGLDAGYESHLSTQIIKDLWTKFVVLNAAAPLCVLSRQPVGVLRSDSRLRAFMVSAMQEVIAVAKARGVELDDNLISYSLNLTDHREYGAKVSMLNDLEAGKRMELEWICGYISNEGQRLGIATPIADLAYACLRPSANGTHFDISK